MSIHGLPIAYVTTHFRLIDGAWYHDAWVYNEDGSLRPVSILRELLP